MYGARDSFPIPLYIISGALQNTSCPPQTFINLNSECSLAKYGAICSTMNTQNHRLYRLWQNQVQLITAFVSKRSYGTFYEKMTLVDFFKFSNVLLGTKTLYKTALTHLKLDYPS